MLDEDWPRHCLGVVLRIPAVLLIEMLYMDALTLKNVTALQSSGFTDGSVDVDMVLYTFAWLLILLPLRVLVELYLHSLCIIAVVLSHFIFHDFAAACDFSSLTDFATRSTLNRNCSKSVWMNHVASKTSKLDSSVTIFLIQCCLFLGPIYLLKPKRFVLFAWPLLPWISILFGGGGTKLRLAVDLSRNLSAICLLYLVGSNLSSAHGKIKMAWLKLKLVVGIYGWPGMVTWAQYEYQVQNLLISCWLLRYAAQFYRNLHRHLDVDHVTRVGELELFDAQQLPMIVLLTVPQCLTTSVNLFGLSAIVIEVVKLQYFLVRSWLHWSIDNHPPDPVSGPLTGAVDGMTLLIMSLYSDLLNSPLENRFILLSYILFTIASSQFQSIFNIIDPILMALATAHNGSMSKNVRTVLLSVFILAICGLLSYICLFSMSSTFWVFILAYNYLNTFSLMLGSLVIYCVLTVDYVFTQGWDNLDDVMFYIRGACRAVEFVITLAMCGYIMMTFYSEMTSVLGIMMLAAYTYYCIVQRGGKGWKIWSMRRNAANKVGSLPLASAIEILEKNDVCPICYQRMETGARVMHCAHLFHENCLKKWFYIQDKCPICYTQFTWDKKAR